MEVFLNRTDKTDRKFVKTLESRKESIQKIIQPFLSEIELIEYFIEEYEKKKPKKEKPKPYIPEATIFTEYPFEGSFLDKLSYFNQRNPRFWRKHELVKKIMNIEGDDLGVRTTSNCSYHINKMIEQGQLVSFNIKGRKSMTFYGCREWIEVLDDRIEIIASAYPSESFLLSLFDLHRDLIWNL